MVVKELAAIAVTSRKGRVSRNPIPDRIYPDVKVTSRKGRVSRNLRIATEDIGEIRHVP